MTTFINEQYLLAMRTILPWSRRWQQLKSNPSLTAKGIRSLTDAAILYLREKIGNKTMT